VLQRAGKDVGNRQLWRVRCACNTISVVRQNALRTGHTKSCGCLQKEVAAKLGRSCIRTTHGESANRVRNKKVTKEYGAWRHMKDRCYNSKTYNYKNYGARGITICKRWLTSYQNFLADVGRAPASNFSIDRKNNDGNYTPRNVHWATASQQRCNQRPRKCV